MNIKRINSIFVGLISVLVFSGSAFAHTITIGFTPGANNGEVNFWTGSYHSLAENGGVNEGTLTLTGINGTTYAPTTLPFNIAPSTTKPPGLVDGVNNQVANNWAFGSVQIWQGVTFSGLNPGEYGYSCGSTCGTTQVWNSLGGILTGQTTLSGQNIGGGGTGNVPEPVTGLLLGVGVMGLAAMRRKG